MRNRAPLIFGGILILLGILSIIGTIFKIDTGVFCWPLLLIGIGVFILLRPKLEASNASSSFRLLGNNNRGGAWKVSDSETWTLIGDTILDFTQADIPVGETHLHINSFVGDIRLYVPECVGVALISTAMFSDARFFDEHRGLFFGSLEFSTPGYESAERRIHVETFSFMGNVKVKKSANS
jgi:predicted membrane protein